MKNNKVLAVIIIILLIVIIALLVNGKKSDVVYNPQYPSPQNPNPTPSPSPTPNPSPVPNPTPTPSPTPQNDECKSVTGYSCVDYKNGWITAFKLENNLSDSTFNNYISIKSTNFSELGTNYEYTVDYTIKKSWLVVNRKDSMPIYNTDRTHLLAPTEWPLERSSVTTGRSGLSTIHLNDTLSFSNSSSAINYFMSQHNLSGTNPTIRTQGFQYFWNKESADSHNSPFAGEGGEAYISIFGKINSSQNKCYEGSLALVSQETTYTETPCMIN